MGVEGLGGRANIISGSIAQRAQQTAGKDGIDLDMGDGPGAMLSFAGAGGAELDAIGKLMAEIRAVFEAQDSQLLGLPTAGPLRWR